MPVNMLNMNMGLTERLGSHYTETPSFSLLNVYSRCISNEWHFLQRSYPFFPLLLFVESNNLWTGWMHTELQLIIQALMCIEIRIAALISWKMCAPEMWIINCITRKTNRSSSQNEVGINVSKQGSFSWPLPFWTLLSVTYSLMRHFRVWGETISITTSWFRYSISKKYGHRHVSLPVIILILPIS